MLAPIQADSKYLKHKLRLPRNPSSNPNILVIQINFEVENESKQNVDLALKLHECLSVIDRGVLIELKKLLPYTNNE